MELIATPPPSTGRSPFRDHDVREWSRIDTITGALERARLETDSWAASTSNTSHRYGKVVDSRARTDANGSLQAEASRQLEVFQSRAAGTRLQVVKTTTVSSSRWSGKGDVPPIKGLGFEDLQLQLNPLDLTSEKSKASVGRSVNRRPPSRHPRTHPSTFSSNLHSHFRTQAHSAATSNLHRVSRLCHQIHESAVRNALGRKSPTNIRRGSADSSSSGIKITEIESSATSSSDLSSHKILSRTKSNSSDDIHEITEKETVKTVEDLEGLEELQNWRRNSKIRRSLQVPKVVSPTEEKNQEFAESTANVKKLRDELEKDRRLTTALRNNSVSSDINILDDIIQSISSTNSLERSSTDDNLDNLSETNTKKKRESFVTVETLQQVKERLRRTSAHTNGTETNDGESDDGIVTEDINTKYLNSKLTNFNKVKSYVYGMENKVPSKKSIIGTGSLESRSKFINGISNQKNEDWYNRRKSYGFEKVHGHEEPASISFKSKNLIESSTDSGICRSNEIMVVPAATKQNINNQTNGRYNTDSDSDVENGFNKTHNSIHYGNVKKMTSIFDHQGDKNSYSNRSSDELTKAWNKRPTDDWKKSDIKSTTITIPIVKNNNVVDLSWNNEPEKEIKRTVANADEKFTANNGTENRLRKVSLVSNEQNLKNDNLEDDNLYNSKKGKKVEFCKTEVHFAAESGKVNIVETDEKPPPTQNFRRKRRNSGPLNNYAEDFNKNGLPILHFGDSSYEKTMFGITDDDDSANKPSKSLINDCISNAYENLPQKEQTSLPQKEKSSLPSAFSVVTVNNSHDYNHREYSEDEKKELLLAEHDNLKGILKNKPIKPKPYHLGVPMSLNDSTSEEDIGKWGVKLRHVSKENPTIWKSTVTVHNSFQDIPVAEKNNITNKEQPEFQKLLRNLRPTSRRPEYLSDNENRYSDSFANIRVVSPAKDNRRSSWSVADRVKLVDEMQENKGYSTKVNFGNGEATVVHNDQSTWPRMENLSKDSRQILNKGLVVRIGRQDSASKHTLCSKMTTTKQDNNTTTTTKITIDLSPSPPTTDDKLFTYTKFKRSQNTHSFKSTPLVLNTLKDQKVTAKKVPKELEALKKLYEDIPSDEGDSDADMEVQQLLSRVAGRELTNSESDNSSVVSGSWSKMKAFKNFAHTSKSNFKEVNSKFGLNHDKDFIDNPQRLKPVRDSNRSSSNCNQSIPSCGSQFSPVVLRKSIPIAPTELKELIKPEEIKNINSPLVNRKSSIINSNNNRESPNRDFKNLPDTKLQAKYVNENIVLRQPKKSEMTYFGVDVSPKPSREVIQRAVIKKEQKLSQKPDLLQHYKRSPSPPRVVKPRRPTPENDNKSPSSPIYENLKPISNSALKYKYSSNKDFDSSILEELTKAADQILQAVNGYTSEDCQNRLSSDEELKKPLDTISETKSWRNTTQQLEIKNQFRMRPTLASAAKVKVKRTSSTSSVESLSKERRKSGSADRRLTKVPISTTASEEKTKMKTSSDTSSAKASTKARRLQRASSREALLQSHGSSSEDLPTNIDSSHRKPRLVKKTKTAQLTMTNGLELKRPVRRSREEKTDSSKSEGRIMGSLPEIRHKTAVSTITSTVRSRTQNDESKSKSHTKRESSNKGTISSSSIRPTTNRAQHTHQSHRATAKESSSGGVTQHRISTAYVPACSARRRHKHAQQDECPCVCS